MSSPEQKTSHEPPQPIFNVVNHLTYLFAEASKRARIDQLTGTLNKDAWKYELQERLETSDGPVGVILMDMDGFKSVNDTLGHGRGDSLLEQFGNHMRKHFRRSGDSLTHEKFIQNDKEEGDLGRMGGDEFGLLFDPSGNHQRASTPQESMDQTLRYTRSVIDEFVATQPKEIQALGFNVSIGAAIREKGEVIDASELLERADIAMYADKSSREAVR